MFSFHSRPRFFSGNHLTSFFNDASARSFFVIMLSLIIRSSNRVICMCFAFLLSAFYNRSIVYAFSSDMLVLLSVLLQRVVCKQWYDKIR
uniref:7TM_GPCR_Srx domain-containing protein n=1 Tax=Ascaris lumbricoides TaxID=6252 RepID=A0A0M3HRZ5_ASCLU